MASREIIIEISPEGVVRGDISGFGGKNCREMAKLLAEIVGEEVSFDPNSEYFQGEVHLGVDVNTDEH